MTLFNIAVWLVAVVLMINYYRLKNSHLSEHDNEAETRDKRDC